MKVGVMGAGAIGCFVGGKLAGGRAEHAPPSVVLVGRERITREIDDHGLVIQDMDLPELRIPKGRMTTATEPSVLADCDVVLFCVKSGATASTAEAVAPLLKKDAIVISLQNGVRNADEIRARVKQRVFAGIVNFNVLSKGSGVFRRATTGPIVIEDGQHAHVDALSRALHHTGVEVERVVRMRELQWSKLLFNLNNAVSALSNQPTKRIVLSPGYRRVLSAVILEGLEVLEAAKIEPARLGAFPVRWLVRALRLPTPLFRIVARAQLRIDPEARSSMWEDLTSGRPTEVDWLNGEIVRLAAEHHASAPLNGRIVEIVHEAERAGRGSPKLDAEALWRAIHAHPAHA
jgi:2-dehydropantoate 2-reductase